MAARTIHESKLLVILWIVCLNCILEVSGKSVEHGESPVDSIQINPTSGGVQRDEAELLQVFIIPHSHMDVGWVYTVQESLDNYVYDAYNTVVEELSKNSSRRFIAVEQEFFRSWWTQVASSTQKTQVHNLVKSGQLEFVIGGQVMHDEAVTEYSATIQQMTDGNSFIYETFGVRPHFSWQIDPFGASAASPTLFALTGFDAHLIDRIDYDKKQAMMKNKTLQFVWQASPSLGADQQIFTHVMDSYMYCMPGNLENKHLNWLIDFLEQDLLKKIDQPIQMPDEDQSYWSLRRKTGFFWNGYAVFPKPPDGNYPETSIPVNAETVKSIAYYMVSNIKERAAWFATNHLLWPWGCDKQFFNATVMYENMDKLMTYINSHSSEYGLKLQYATVGEYFKAIHSADHTWDLKDEGDFLPYVKDYDDAWSGFYASHGRLKGLARSSQATLHAAEGLFTLYNFHPRVKSTNKTTLFKTLKGLRKASAEVQHHDGITGTMSPKVFDMYHHNLMTNRNETRHAIGDMINELMSGGDQDSGIRLADVSSDKGHEILQNIDGQDQIPLVAYNPLGWLVKRLMPVNVTTPNVTVIDIHGRPVGSQVNPPLAPGEPYRLFIYVQLPPLTYGTYFIQYPSNQVSAAEVATVERNPAKSRTKMSLDDSNRTDMDETVAISNDCFVITYDKHTNMMVSITNKLNGAKVPMQQVFMEYNAHYNVLYGKESNSYSFRPMGAAHDVGDMVTLDIITGPYVNETVQSYYNFYDPVNSRYTVTLRLHDLPHQHEDPIVCGHIELDFRVGPLYTNKELIYRFQTDLSSSKILYTDVNGYQTMKRTYNKHATSPIAQNYYPMVSWAFIEDETRDIRLTLLANSAHGVSSLKNGEMEVLLHRRILNNAYESNNLNLTLNDTSVLHTTLWMMVDNRTHSSQLQHQAQLQLENLPHMIAVDTKTLGSGSWAKQLSAEETELLDQNQLLLKWLDHHRPRLSLERVPVFNELPANLHLLTLQIPGWNFSTNHTAHLREINQKVAGGTHTPSEVDFDRLLIRLHHVFEKDEHPKLSKPAKVDLADFLSPLGHVATVEERSLTSTWNVKDVKRWKWKTKTNKVTPGKQHLDNRAEDVDEATHSSSDSVVTLNPQEIKTFFVTFQGSYRNGTILGGS